MVDRVLTNLYYGGEIVYQPTMRYAGGLSTALNIEVDKMSFFEISDYAVEYGKYKKGSFSLHWVVPGMDFEGGLLPLSNDSDVASMLDILGPRFTGVVSLFVNPMTQEVEPIINVSPKAQPNPSEAHLGADSVIDNLHQKDEVAGSGCDSEGIDIEEDTRSVGLKKDEVVGAESDTDDEEWYTSVQTINKANKVGELSENHLVNNILRKTDPHDSAPVEENEDEELKDQGYSSYEDSEADVNSPGESDDDNIRGKKYLENVPIINENTDWSRWTWVVGTRFSTRFAFKDAVRRYAVNNGRNLKISISDRKRHGRIGVSCVSGCPFRLYLSVNIEKGCFMLKTAITEHKCQRNMTRNRQLSTEFVATEFLPIFKTKPHWSAKEIQAAVKEKFKVFIGKWFAYKAKSIAHKKLHGSMKEHYAKLGSYLQILREKNPTSTFNLVTVPSSFHGIDSENEVFFRIFVCFDGVKKGFLAGCRKLLCLDGCFLKTFLGGILLAAIGRDSNDQMYPVAWAVVEGENNDSWGWFMKELYNCLDVTNEGKGWTLISDQQKGLLNGVAQFWAKSEHRNCARHIYANWHKKHKGDDLKEAFWKAVRAYSEADHNIAMQELRVMDNDAADDFIKQNPKCFCRCFLDTTTKADVVVNNMAETFNGFIIQSRSKHLTHMLEDIRLAIMTRLRNKKMEMQGKETLVCPRILIKLEKEKNRAYRCEINPSTESLYQISDMADEVVVDLENNTCTCRKWDLTGIPCYHACALFGFLQRPVEEYVNVCYRKETYMKAYQFSIPPLPSQKYWPYVNAPLDPPPIKKMPGRPKKNRKKDPHEDPKKPGRLTKHGIKMHCSVCKATTHNILKCPKRDKAKGRNEVPKEKKPRGRPKKIAKTTEGAGTSSGKPVEKPKRGRPRKVAPQLSQSSQVIQASVLDP